MMATHITLSRIQVEEILSHLDDACNDVLWNPNIKNDDIDRMTDQVGRAAEIIYEALEEAESAPVTARN